MYPDAPIYNIQHLIQIDKYIILVAECLGETAQLKVGYREMVLFDVYVEKQIIKHLNLKYCIGVIEIKHPYDHKFNTLNTGSPTH